MVRPLVPGHCPLTLDGLLAKAALLSRLDRRGLLGPRSRRWPTPVAERCQPGRREREPTRLAHFFPLRFLAAAFRGRDEDDEEGAEEVLCSARPPLAAAAGTLDPGLQREGFRSYRGRRKEVACAYLSKEKGLLPAFLGPGFLSPDPSSALPPLNNLRMRIRDFLVSCLDVRG